MPRRAPEGELSAAALAMWARLGPAIDDSAFSLALSEIWSFVGAANRLIDREKPWELAKSDIPRCAEVVATLVEALRVLSVVTGPFMPRTATKLAEGLGLEAVPALLPGASSLSWGELPEGLQTKVIPPLFPRLDVQP